MKPGSANGRQQLEELRRELTEGPPLAPCQTAEMLVLGEGSPEARLMIVGEAPGEQEEKQGRPFVGRAGQLLRRTLMDAGISPEDVWISNVVKCRPTVVQGGRTANRTPTAAEAAAWLPWLLKEIEILQPKVIICLGNLAANVLIHKGFKMTEERGRWFQGRSGAAVLATYHPSYVLRQIGLPAENVRREFREDLDAARKRLEN